MAKVKIKVTVTDSEGCQLVIKVGDKTIDFQKGGSKELELEPKRYTAMLAGFQDPAAGNDALIKAEFLQGTNLLNDIEINGSSFIKSLRITVK